MTMLDAKSHEKSWAESSDVSDDSYGSTKSHEKSWAKSSDVSDVSDDSAASTFSEFATAPRLRGFHSVNRGVLLALPEVDQSY